MLDKAIFYKTMIPILLMWVIFMSCNLGWLDCSKISIFRENGVISIFTGVFVHGNLNHLIGNTKGLLITLPLMFYLHRKRAKEIIISGIFFPSFFVFLFGLNVVGMSGLIYCLLWFLILSGLGSMDKERFIISMVLIFVFGDSLLGITSEAGYNIAWQCHLFGFLLGSFYAFRKVFKV